MKCLQPQPLWVQSYQNCWHVFRGRAANRDLMWHCSRFMQKSIKLLKASAESKKTQDEKGQQFFGSSNVVAQILLPGLPASLFSLNLFGLVWNESVMVLPQESCGFLALAVRNIILIFDHSIFLSLHKHVKSPTLFSNVSRVPLGFYYLFPSLRALLHRGLRTGLTPWPSSLGIWDSISETMYLPYWTRVWGKKPS